MITPSDLSGWVQRIHESWGQTGIATSRGVSWMQMNLPKLNILLSTGFYISGEDIVPDMPFEVSGIYEEMYYCDYLNKKASENLGAAAYDWTEISGEDQGTVRRVSKNEVAKTLNLMSKDCKERLDKLVDWYMSQNTDFPGVYQILYNDRGTVADFGLINYNSPPTAYYSQNNTIFIQ